MPNAEPKGADSVLYLSLWVSFLAVKGVLLQAVVAHPGNVDMQGNFVLAAGDVHLLTPPVECDRDEPADRRAKLERLGETNLLVSSELHGVAWNGAVTMGRVCLATSEVVMQYSTLANAKHSQSFPSQTQIRAWLPRVTITSCMGDIPPSAPQRLLSHSLQRKLALPLYFPTSITTSRCMWHSR